jgi:hypothetical protein
VMEQSGGRTSYYFRLSHIEVSTLIYFHIDISVTYDHDIAVSAIAGCRYESIRDEGVEVEARWKLKYSAAVFDVVLTTPSSASSFVRGSSRRDILRAVDWRQG